MSNRYLQYIQNAQPKEKAGWIEPVATGLGAVGGFLIGGPPGAMAGASIGSGVGDTAGDVVNNRVDMNSLLQNAGQVGAGWSGMNGLFFANGGPVTGGQMPWWVQAAMAQQQGQPQQPVAPPVPDMAQGRQMLEQFAGPAPTPFQPREASHPTLEMLASIIPQVLQSMPKPVKPNNRAIGTWLPAIGTAIGAPAKYAQAKRQAYNEAGQEQYDAQVDARNKRMAAAAPSVAGYLTREEKQATAVGEEDRPMTEQESVQVTGTPRWKGYSLRYYKAWREAQQKPEKPSDGRGAQKDELGVINTLSDNARQDKDIQNFVVVRDNFNRIASSGAQANGVDDMSLIFAYMKVLDPTSVVRETEYKNAAQAIGVLPQLANIPMNWIRGDKLTPEGRRGFVAAARRLYNRQLVAYRRAKGKYESLAKRYGVPPELILQDLESDAASVNEQGAASSTAPTRPTAGRKVN